MEWKNQNLTFVSLDGERFDGVKKAQEYCKQKHFSKPPPAKKRLPEVPPRDFWQPDRSYQRHCNMHSHAPNIGQHVINFRLAKSWSGPSHLCLPTGMLKNEVG